MRFRSHQVAKQPTKRTSLQSHALRLVHELPVHSLPGAELDAVLLVESPQCVRADLAVEVVLQQLCSLRNAVRCPSLHHLIRQQHRLHVLANASEVPRLLHLHQRIHALPTRDELVQHPVHRSPRNAQLLAHLPHCTNLPSKPAHRPIARHHYPAAVAIVQPPVQLLVEALREEQRPLWRPAWRPVAEVSRPGELEVGEVLAEGEMLRGKLPVFLRSLHYIAVEVDHHSP